MGMKWLIDDNGALLGINLGFDYAAEHEWGIRGIAHVFGLDSEACGIDKTRIRKLPRGMETGESMIRVTVPAKPHAYEGLFLVEGRYCKDAVEYLKDWRGQWTKSDGSLLCAWGRFGFGFFDSSAEGKSRADEMYEAFKALDISIENNGRHFALRILSRISEKEKAELLSRDLDAKALKQAALDTGIEAELLKAGRRWFALNPAWTDSKKTSLRFFLNPCEQHLHNYGWFSLEDLQLWVQGKGPIVMASPRVR